MSLSRWKIMAGVLGVSLGGLAAASQCPKTEGKRLAGRQADPPSLEVPAIPAVPPAGSPAPKTPAPAGPVVPVELPPPPASDLPALPLPTTPAKTSEKPPTLPSAPAGGPTSPPAPVIPVGGTSDTKAGPALPVPGGLDTPTKSPELPKTADPIPGPTTPATGSSTPGSAPPVPPAFPTEPTRLSPPVIGPAGPPAGAAVEFTKPAAKPDVRPAAAVSPVKFRILLQVGEGEPKFEVKYGDDLVLKVVSEKIDIKSPEKGTGPSDVRASGKVRFVGFGAEGVCDELRFLAGTGEVQMTGDVKIAVKDKLGRVESELSAQTLKYRIDPSVIIGALRP